MLHMWFVIYIEDICLWNRRYSSCRFYKVPQFQWKWLVVIRTYKEGIQSRNVFLLQRAEATADVIKNHELQNLRHVQNATITYRFKLVVPNLMKNTRTMGEETQFLFYTWQQRNIWRALSIHMDQKSWPRYMGKGDNKYLLMIRSTCLKKVSIYILCSFSIGLESSSNFVDEPAKEKYSV